MHNDIGFIIYETQAHISGLAEAIIMCSKATSIMISKMKEFPTEFASCEEFINLGNCAEKLLGMGKTETSTINMSGPENEGKESQDSETQVTGNPKVRECVDNVINIVTARNAFTKSTHPLDIGISPVRNPAAMEVNSNNNMSFVFC